MRFYGFSNMYMSSIQNGIQNAHAIADMFVKYGPRFVDNTDTNPTSDSDKYDTLYYWAENHKTMILLNGGYSENIRGLAESFDDDLNKYPWAAFHEGQDALDGALTTVGIILPEKIYGTAAYMRTLRASYREQLSDLLMETGEVVVGDGHSAITYTFNKFEVKLMLQLNDFSLAN